MFLQLLTTPGTITSSPHTPVAKVVETLGVFTVPFNSGLALILEEVAGGLFLPPLRSLGVTVKVDQGIH